LQVGKGGIKCHLGEESGEMFRGLSIHTIDQKGRLAIPARFRDTLNDRGEGSVIITHGTSCLMAFAPDRWKIIEEKAAALPIFDRRYRDFIRLFISSAMECAPDKQGRVLIPSNLRQYAQLEKEVVLAGMLNNFEIWDRTKWETTIEAGRDNETLLMEGAEKLGF